MHNKENGPLYRGEALDVLRIEVGLESHVDTYTTKAPVTAVIWNKVTAREETIQVGSIKSTFLGVTCGWYKSFEAYISGSSCPDGAHRWERLSELQLSEIINICLCPKCLSTKGISKDRRRY